ncbi:CLUMA_CG001793, isoform A [Clunio marinus]|uniref:CLUMA_CG001793, isoform A n=1 Tax=Clunio marinus TaxID=568069 RepID=A0A1J1HIZ5_9DIPT|nr:CLUMA_CG001793, isoform A [Clunio marinus]
MESMINSQVNVIDHQSTYATPHVLPIKESEKNIISRHSNPNQTMSKSTKAHCDAKCCVNKWKSVICLIN